MAVEGFRPQMSSKEASSLDRGTAKLFDLVALVSLHGKRDLVSLSR